MFVPGKLIYFDPFHFEDGTSKPKYFLVLKVYNGNVLLASLPSSQFHLPSNQSIAHGCLEVKDSGIGCYVFMPNTCITKCGWSFPKTTFLYGQWLDEYIVDDLLKKYSIPNIDYEEIGELTEEEMKNIIQCFSSSSVVKRKYKKLLA